MRFGPHPLSLRQLQYVVAVADTKSFRQAAERCLVSQPSLSAQIAEIEGALDLRLFERSRRGVILTKAGEALVEGARRVLLSVEDLLDTAKRHADPLSGTLRVGVIPTLAPYFLPIVDPALRAEFPALTLLWSEDKTRTLVQRIQRGELDAALLALEANLEDLEHAVVGRDPFVVAMPPGHALGESKGEIPLQALQNESVLLLDEGHCFREQALELCSSAGAEELGFRATSLSTLAQMVAAGSGITLLPRLSLEVENRRGQLMLRTFAAPEPYRTIVLGWRRRSALTEPLKRLAQTAARAFAAEASRPVAKRTRFSASKGADTKRRPSPR